MAFTNQGTIIANQSNTLTDQSVTGANDFTTSGTMQVLAGSTAGAWAAAIISIRPPDARQSTATLTVTSALVDIQGGILDGTGTVNGNVSERGHRRAGPNSPGMC